MRGKRARFLTEVGTEVYSTLSNLLAPTKPKDTPIVDIVRVLEKHYNPKPLEIAQSFHIGSRNQKSGESVGDYVLALKRLAVHCNYGEFLDRALRDRFVCSLSNQKIQNKLSNTQDLTFEKACRIANAMEMAERYTQEFHPTISESPQLNQLTAQDNKNTNHEQCFRCSGNNHSGKSCKFKSAKRYRRSKIGHLAFVCRGKNERRKGTVHNLHVSESCDDELGIYSLYSLHTNSPSPSGYSVEMLINGKPCKMEVYTAADYSIMARSVYLEKFADTPLTPSKVVLLTHTGEVLEVSGEMLCNKLVARAAFIDSVGISSAHLKDKAFAKLCDSLV